MLVKAVGHRTKHIFTAGLRPALTYGVEVNGATDSDLRNWRRIAGKFYKPRTGGRSLTATLLINDDPWPRPPSPLPRGGPAKSGTA